MEDSLSVEMDRDISLEIPARTVIAYSLIELEIEKNGKFGKFINVCIYMSELLL